MDFIKKIEWIRKFLEKNNLSAFLFTSFPNIFYLTQFRSSNAFIIIMPQKNYFLTDARYFEMAKNKLKDWEVILIENDTFSFFKKIIKKLKIKNLGFEKDGITYDFKEKLKIKGIRFKGFNGVLKDLRIIKDEEELKLLKEGIKKTDQVYREIVKFLREEIFSKIKELTELRLRGILISKIFELGGEGESFPAIIASGKNSAIPHWESSHNKIKINAPLLIDMGIVWKGYCTDFTRTIYLGKPHSEFKNFYEIVKTAWYKGFEKVKSGIPVSEIDKTIREYFRDKGVDKFFLHATGHGIGVEIHEPPRIYYKETFAKKRKKDEEIIKDGMVFTIEPGLYFPNKFGIRLENMVFVEKGKGEIYSEIGLNLEIIN
ncbi:MAG: aminopeptidase P family protein [Thermodesulfobacterium geofontis]|uniref:Aminopeptidase P family protein n=1 Tax=Thermodesulfobacterium geofontis TaxID=1295609 RepID=A0A2N7PPN4_9BACT|nr:MAG: aminopeptidase P family protein [Thermodesulfobacterium geofontis]